MAEIKTVKDLKEYLQQYQDDTKVVYDDGLPLEVSEITIHDKTVLNFT